MEIFEESGEKIFSIALESTEFDFGRRRREWMAKINFGGNKIDRCGSPSMIGSVANFELELGCRLFLELRCASSNPIKIFL